MFPPRTPAAGLFRFRPPSAVHPGRGLIGYSGSELASTDPRGAHPVEPVWCLSHYGYALKILCRYAFCLHFGEQ